MDVTILERQLHEEGFCRTYTWQDGPGAHHPDHTHPVESAHVILEGEMTLTRDGISQTSKQASARPTCRPARCIPPAWAQAAAAT